LTVFLVGPSALQRRHGLQPSSKEKTGERKFTQNGACMHDELARRVTDVEELENLTEDLKRFLLAYL